MSMIEPAPQPSAEGHVRTGTPYEHRAANFMERIGLTRIAGGILLIVLGVLVLVLPELLVWFVGIAAIVVGILLLVYPSPEPLRV